jgi:hypothetical protein
MPKISRRKKIVKNREEISEIEIKKTIEKVDENELIFLKIKRSPQTFN